MAVELRNVLGKALRTPKRLPATLIFDHPTIEAIARFVDRTFVEPLAAVPAPAAAPPEAVSHADLDSMDDAEVEALLNRRLERI
jgi:hypothetical protein